MSEDNKQVQDGQEVATNSKEKTTTYTAQEVASFIAESKKYRQRAQASEDENAKLKKQQEMQKLKQMEEQEKWKDLANEYKGKYDKAQQYEVKYNEIEGMMRNDYLTKLPENIRENYGSTDLKTLQNIVNDFNANKTAPVSNAKAGRFGGYETPEELALNDAEGYKNMKKKNIMDFFKPSAD